MISVVELFSGIGAIRKALNKSNIKYKVNFISEINKNTFKAYQSIFLDKKIWNLGDISKIKKEDVAVFKNKTDLLMFGSPCQDFSVAGWNKGGGTLWY